MPALKHTIFRWVVVYDNARWLKWFFFRNLSVWLKRSCGNHTSNRGSHRPFCSSDVFSLNIVSVHWLLWMAIYLFVVINTVHMYMWWFNNFSSKSNSSTLFENETKRIRKRKSIQLSEFKTFYSMKMAIEQMACGSNRILLSQTIIPIFKPICKLQKCANANANANAIDKFICTSTISHKNITKLAVPFQCWPIRLNLIANPSAYTTI